MAKTTHIDLGDGSRVPILFENRSLLVLDKPAGWVLTPDVPVPGRSNLQLAIESSIKSGAYWARQRSLKFLRFIHRLDADTSGALMFGKHLGAMRPLSMLFSQRRVEKLYLAVTHGVPKQDRWVCQLPLGHHPEFHGMHQVDPENGKQAETHFQVLQKNDRAALVLVRPVTGRTHQIRLHLMANRTPVAGDRMYAGADRDMPLGLRSIRLEFVDPFEKKPIKVSAPIKDFVRLFKFDPVQAEEQIKLVRFDPPIGPVETVDDDEEEDAADTDSARPAGRRDDRSAPRPRPAGRPPFRTERDPRGGRSARDTGPEPRRMGGDRPSRPLRGNGPRPMGEKPWRPEGAEETGRRPSAGPRPSGSSRPFGPRPAQRPSARPGSAAPSERRPAGPRPPGPRRDPSGPDRRPRG